MMLRKGEHPRTELSGEEPQGYEDKREEGNMPRAENTEGIFRACCWYFQGTPLSKP